MGAVAGPFDAWLTLRGAQDPRRAHGPALRQRRARSSTFLDGHPKVTAGALPGPARAPRPRGRGQADAPASAAWSRFRVAGGEERGARRSATATELFTLGESLGGVESLIEHPGRMTHASVAGSDARGARRPRPALGRHRDRRRPDRRPGAGAGVELTGRCSRRLRRLRVDVHQGGAGRRRRRRCRPAARTAAARRRSTTGTSSTGSTRPVAAVVADAARRPGRGAGLLVSAGGGLRLAVVGYERAGHRRGRRAGSALSAGAKVVARRRSGELDRAELAALRRPARRRAARRRHRRRQRRGAAAQRAAPRRPPAGAVPVVVAGNVDARDEVVATCSSAERRTSSRRQRAAADRRARTRTRRGPRSARSSCATSSAARSSRRGPTVRRARARRDPGRSCSPASSCSPRLRGAATCWSSTSAARRPTSTRCSRPTPRRPSLHREVVEVMWRGRTVEGDLGMRWSATGVADAALAERSSRPVRRARPDASALAQVRHDDPSWLPATDAERADDATYRAARAHGRAAPPRRPADTVDGPHARPRPVGASRSSSPAAASSGTPPRRCCGDARPR